MNDLRKLKKQHRNVTLDADKIRPGTRTKYYISNNYLDPPPRFNMLVSFPTPTGINKFKPNFSFYPWPLILKDDIKPFCYKYNIWISS